MMLIRVSSSSDWPAKWMAMGAPLAIELHSAHTVCVAAVCAHIAASLAAMQRLKVVLDDASLGVTGSDSRRPRLFMLLWSSMLDVFAWFEKWPPFLISPRPIDLRALYPLLNTLLVWVLKVARRGTAIQQILSAYVTEGEMWQTYVFRVIEFSNLLLRSICMFPPMLAYKSVIRLPPGFIATLCCLACDVDPRSSHEAKRRSSVPCPEMCISHYTQVVCILQIVLDTFLGLVSAHASTSGNQELFSAATVEVVKRVVCLCPITPTLTAEQTMGALKTLSTLLMHAAPLLLGPITKQTKQ